MSELKHVAKLSVRVVGVVIRTSLFFLFTGARLFKYNSVWRKCLHAHFKPEFYSNKTTFQSDLDLCQVIVLLNGFKFIIPQTSTTNNGFLSSMMVPVQSINHHPEWCGVKNLK